MSTFDLEQLARRMPLAELRRQLRYWIGQVLVRAGAHDRGHAMNYRQVFWSELCRRERDGRLEEMTAEQIYTIERQAAERERRGLEAEHG